MTVKDTYLTVDLDYWNSTEEPSAGAIVAKVLSLNIPVSVYVDHHLVLNDLKGRTYSKIINIDEHDDLTADTKDKLDEGNWVGHVPFKGEAIYEWRCPDDGEGCACDGEEGNLTWGEAYSATKNKTLKVWRDGVCGWGRIQMLFGLDGLNFSRIDRASFILSPAYVKVERIRDALTILAFVQDRVSCSTRIRRALKRALNNQSPLFNENFLRGRRRANPTWHRSDYGLSWA